MSANPLKKLSALGQSIWLDYISRDLITSGKLEKLIKDDDLKGITSNPSIFEKTITEGSDYEKLTQDIVRDAADVLGKDGYVSLEVNPHLAYDTEGTIIEARRLWKSLARPNVFIKVPGTRQGLPAIKTLISEGINVNVTLLFGLPRYREVIEAYISGLELRVSRGEPIKDITSVASFFISRIDTLIDPTLEKKSQGQIAIASAKMAYQIYLESIHSDRFKKLIEKSAQTQRLLWASTSTKNPAYSDIKYVEALIGPDTVNTVPMETLDAYRDHGDPKLRLQEGLDQLPSLGANIDKFTQQLEDEGVEKFKQAYDQLLATLWKNNNLKRFWEKDASLWTNTDEAKWMGWLTIVEEVPPLKATEFKDMVLLGMGGSSLCPDMLAKIFGVPRFHVLDSTDPQQIRHLENKIDVNKTLFIVSSKSGSTLEPNIFKDYFYKDNSDHFIAITDPGSSLDKLAQNEHFKAIFHGVPSIGGRYSALSNFGMVPAELMGLDVKTFLHNATLPKDNPAFSLGITLGEYAKQGKDKVTLILSPDIKPLGAWLEQLLAESTGKMGKGLIPVDNEPLGAPDVYEHDRVFAYIRLDSNPDLEQDRQISLLEKSGHVVIRLALSDKYHLSAELFRWEIATAVAGSIIGINPFNQPDVEASKVRALEKVSHITPSLPIKNNSLELLSSLKMGDYMAICAFIEMSDEHTALLQKIRTLIRDTKKVATCLGFGPRFLHSTGQLYKGGPNTGVFLQITADRTEDLKIPGHPYTFGQVIDAQAEADFEVMVQRKRRIFRIHLGHNVLAGLQQLCESLQHALQFNKDE